MAEIESARGRDKKSGIGVKKSKKLSSRIDLTPMVDLGFLLISFFMMSTTLAKPKTMEINMPYKDPLVSVTPTEVKASAVLTVLPAHGHRIFYYKGFDTGGSYSAAYFVPEKGIRAVITAKKKEVDSLKRLGVLGAREQATVFIKPDTSSTYADIVGLLDEMNINDISTYAILDITQAEQQRIRSKAPLVYACFAVMGRLSIGSFMK